MAYKNIEKKRAYARKWDIENPGRIAAYREEWRRNHPNFSEHTRGIGLKHRFGITLDQWNELFTQQGKCCAICAATEPGRKTGWHTDHCHETKKVRGILCHGCNVGLGAVKDNIQRLKAMIVFLEKHNAAS